MRIRRILGVAVLAGVAAIALGLDRGVLTQVSLASPSGLEQSLIDRLHPKKPGATTAAAGDPDVPQTMPELSGAVSWLNSPHLTRAALGPAADGKPIRFRVSIDGNAPG